MFNLPIGFFSSFSVVKPEQTIFTTQTPVSFGNDNSYELGTKFQSNVSGKIIAIRFWKMVEETGLHTGHIWTSSGTELTSVNFSGESASGWQRQNLSTPLSISANTTYIVSVNNNTYYPYSFGGLASQITNGDLKTVVGNNGVFNVIAGLFPDGSYGDSSYLRDIVFQAD